MGITLVSFLLENIIIDDISYTICSLDFYISKKQEEFIITGGNKDRGLFIYKIQRNDLLNTKYQFEKNLAFEGDNKHGNCCISKGKYLFVMK